MSFSPLNKHFYAVYLQPTTLKHIYEKHASEQVGKLNWFPNDKTELAQLKHTDNKTFNADTFIHLMDSPQNRIKLSSVRNAFTPKLETLEPEKPREGWLAQLFDIFALTKKQASTLSAQKGSQLLPYGNPPAVKSLDSELLKNRIQLEGFKDIQDVKEQWQTLFKAKAAYLAKADSKLEGRSAYISAIHNALKQSNPLEFSNEKHAVNQNLLLRELLKQMIYLHNKANKSQNTELASPYKQVLDRLRLKHGLELVTLQEPTIISRQMKGVVLKADQLKRVIKQRGDVISHNIIHTPLTELHDIDPIGKNETVIHGPKIVDNAKIITARGQIEGRIKQNLEALSRIFSVPTQYSLIAGIETQKIVPGKTLKELFSHQPELLTRNVVRQLSQMQQTAEKLGLEVIDWSIHNFMVSSDQLHSPDFKIHMVDLGSIKPIPSDKMTAQHATERHQRIGTIVSSIDKNQTSVRQKLTAFLDELSPKNPY